MLCTVFSEGKKSEAPHPLAAEIARYLTNRYSNKDGALTVEDPYDYYVSHMVYHSHHRTGTHEIISFLKFAGFFLELIF